MRRKVILKRKGLTDEALVLIVISVIALVSVLWIGKNVVNAFIGDPSAESFNNLLSQFSSLKEGEARPILLSLSANSAIVGFSTEGKEFRCIGCNLRMSGNRFYLFITKPSYPECTSKPCSCLLKGISIGSIQKLGNEEAQQIKYGTATCQSLNSDIPQKIDLKGAYTGTPVNPPYWENGFFFVNSKDTSNVGYLRKPSDTQKSQIFIELKILNSKNYAAACPQLPCILSQQN